MKHSRVLTYYTHAILNAPSAINIVLAAQVSSIATCIERFSLDTASQHTLVRGIAHLVSLVN